MNRIYFDGNWHSYIEVTSEVLTQNKIDARTPVRISVRLGQDSGYASRFTDTYGAYLAFRLGGQTKYLYFETLDLNGNSRHLGTLEFLVQHNENGDADGTLTIWSGDTRYITFSEFYWGSMLQDISIAIPHINRSGVIDSVSPNAELGKPVTVTIKDREEGLEHQVWWKAFGRDWVDLGKKAGKVFTFTPSRELHKNAGNSATGKLNICVRTFKDGKQYGGDVYKENIPIKIPSDIKPKISDIRFTDNYTKQKKLNIPIFLQNLSDIDYEIVTAADSITEPIEWHLTIESTGKKYYGKTGKLGQFTNQGEILFKAWAVDKHGRESDVITKAVIVNQYKAPQLSFVARRSGTKKNTVTVTTTAKVAPLTNSGRQNNSFSLEFYTRRIEDTQFIKNEGASLKSTSTYELIEHSANLNGTFNSEQSYVIKAVLRDAFREVEYQFSLSTEQVVASYSQWGMGIGKVWERGTLDVGGDIYSNGELVQVGRLTQPNGKSIKYNGDLNNLKSAGGYHAFGVQHSPTGVNNYGYVSVITHSADNGYCVQFYVPFNADQLYMRRSDANRWSDWLRITTASVDTGWKTAILQNGWQHNTEYAHVQYSKTVDDIVFIKGTAKGGNTQSETTVFTLPEEYRPKRSMYKTVINNSFTSGVIAITTEGEIKVKANIDSIWLNLDNISFKI